MRRQVWVYTGLICCTAVLFLEGNVQACLFYVIRPFSIWKAMSRQVWVYAGLMSYGCALFGGQCTGLSVLCDKVVFYLEGNAKACLDLHWFNMPKKWLFI